MTLFLEDSTLIETLYSRFVGIGISSCAGISESLKPLAAVHDASVTSFVNTLVFPVLSKVHAFSWSLGILQV